MLQSVNVASMNIAEGSESFMLTHLVPHTTYAIKLRCKLTKGGFGSEWSEMKNVKTHSSSRSK